MLAHSAQLTRRLYSAKRYERMMRAHGIAPNAASIKPAIARPAKPDHHESTVAEKPSKKRKADAFVEDNGATDDDEVFSTNVKSEFADTKDKKFKVKQEGSGQQLSMSDATNLMQFYDGGAPFDGSNDYTGTMGGQDRKQVYVGDFGGGSASGYATPMSGGDYGLQQSYDFGYEGAGYGGGMPRSSAQGAGVQYQPLMSFKSEPQGRSDSPVIVE
jgi:hypothetical protein